MIESGENVCPEKMPLGCVDSFLGRYLSIRGRIKKPNKLFFFVSFYVWESRVNNTGTSKVSRELS